MTASANFRLCRPRAGPREPEESPELEREVVLALRQRLDRLPPKSAERVAQVASVAELYGVSTDTVYRLLRGVHKPKAARRTDCGQSRVLPKAELEEYVRGYCATIADNAPMTINALKRTVAELVKASGASPTA